MFGCRSKSSWSSNVVATNHYVLVTGGRDFDDIDSMREVLGFLAKFYGDALRVIHGGAKGADSLAGRVCNELNIPARSYPADWNKYGKRAGFLRNEQMVENLKAWRADHGHSVQVISFPGGPGTAHCSRTAEAADIMVDYIPVRDSRTPTP